ncbi:MAG: hypothetical protein WB556_14910, partial [Candidatus Acidiferrum sp.]
VFLTISVTSDKEPAHTVTSRADFDGPAGPAACRTFLPVVNADGTLICASASLPVNHLFAPFIG